MADPVVTLVQGDKVSDKERAEWHKQNIAKAAETLFAAMDLAVSEDFVINFQPTINIAIKKHMIAVLGVGRMW